MIKNYLKVAIRNLLKQKHFAFINISGLALGITASVLIYLWISHETSYDKFVTDYENIYRVTTDAALGGQNFSVCLVPSPLSKQYKEECPEVVETTRISFYFTQIFKYNENNFKEKRVIFADSNFFKLFDLQFIEGNPGKPFNGPQSIVLTETIARKFFGKENALGKTLIMNENDAKMVSAVISDLPSNSHMHFDVLVYTDIPDNWGNFNWITYIKFSDNFSIPNAKSALQRIADNTIIPLMSEAFGISSEQFKNGGNYINLGLQSLSSIHLNSAYYGELETNGNKTYVIFFSVIVILILVIAGINYMNLSTAYYDTRLTEVGIRKANGASGFTLIKQFLFESVLISAAVFVLSFILVRVSMPLFTNFLDIKIDEALSTNWYFLFFTFLGVILMGILSAIYPAVYFASFKTISILKDKLRGQGRQSFRTRSILVISQFTITILVIIATVLIKKQIAFMAEKELGFNKRNLVVVESTNALQDRKETLKSELMKNPQITSVAFSDTYPGEIYNAITSYGVEGRGPEFQYIMKTISADIDYFDTYEMEIAYGRTFDERDRQVIVLNERAVKLMGLESNPFEHPILSNGQEVPVIGVVKDFNHDPLNITLDPILIRKADTRFLDKMIVRIEPGKSKETIDFINERWNTISNNLPFEFHFLDEKLRTAYNAEKKAGRVFSLFSVLSIVIACMGILGIASFLLQKRVKEVGIRKVNGAKVSEVVLLFNRDYLKWNAISFLIATPLAWYLMNKWLDNFAFRTSLSWWVFAMSGVVVLFMALLSVSWQTWRAARRNPVEALKYE